MIVSFFITILSAILSGLIALLPSTSAINSNVDSAITFFAPKFSTWNDVLPVDSLLTIIGLVLTFEAGLLLFFSINWIFNKIRGSG